MVGGTNVMRVCRRFSNVVGNNYGWNRSWEQNSPVARLFFFFFFSKRFMHNHNMLTAADILRLDQVLATFLASSLQMMFRCRRNVQNRPQSSSCFAFPLFLRVSICFWDAPAAITGGETWFWTAEAWFTVQSDHFPPAACTLRGKATSQTHDRWWQPPIKQFSSVQKPIPEIEQKQSHQR